MFHDQPFIGVGNATPGPADLRHETGQSLLHRRIWQKWIDDPGSVWDSSTGSRTSANSGNSGQHLRPRAGDAAAGTCSWNARFGQMFADGLAPIGSLSEAQVMDLRRPLVRGGSIFRLWWEEAVRRHPPMPEYGAILGSLYRALDEVTEGSISSILRRRLLMRWSPKESTEWRFGLSIWFAHRAPWPIRGHE